MKNRRLDDQDDGSGWLGYGGDLDLSNFLTGRHRFNGVLFDIQVNAEKEAALLMHGKLNPAGAFPEQVTLLPKPFRAAELHFLMNTAFRTNEKGRVGAIQIGYTDDTEEIVDLVYGKNIFCYYDKRLGADARIAWTGETRNGKTVQVWDLVWTNPDPKKKVDSITLESAGSAAAPILYAVTGVEPARSRRFLGLF